MRTSAVRNRLEGKNTGSPDVRKAVGYLHRAIAARGVDPKLLALAPLRVSRINGCPARVHARVAGGRAAGDTDERLHSAAAWREAPFRTAPNRAALALAEAATRLQDGAEGAVDTIWNEAAAHFTEEETGAANLEIALTSFFNRTNRTINEPAGRTWG
ncbi:carboxymuconolactone decarboxylase family protein [Streptomyces sp. NPDC058195]|uniref:carboxymuconolactone decarboxylase family protein n=1 Tax=Streptomyces sp. NPDC058195 TaxID=3346375 RepID=UPI0036E74C0A